MSDKNPWREGMTLAGVARGLRGIGTDGGPAQAMAGMVEDAAKLMYDPRFEFNFETQNYSVVVPSAQQVAHDVMMSFNRDIEGKMRRALIDLGWTPPEDPRPTQDAYDAACKALWHWREEAKRLADLAGVEPKPLQR